MATAAPVPQKPVISVIIPARNEEACLGACLQSLVTQAGMNFEIIVVNDGSCDRTPEIAQSFPAVTVVNAQPLPQAWTGKNNALVSGAKIARGEWLLFTDADTVHLPGSLGRSLGEAQRRGTALLSYSPEQEVRGFWEKAIMPVIFAELASVYRPSEVSDTASPVAAANGQYLLVERDAYEAVGGHVAIAATLLEDVALARNVKNSGRRIFFRYGGDAVRARMYRSFSQLREGWTKNLALLFPAPIKLAVRRLREFGLIAAATTAALISAFHGRPALAGALALALVILASLFVARIRKAHFPAQATALSFFGLPLFAYLLLRSSLSYRRGAVRWKGRNYSVPAPMAANGKTPRAA